MKLFAILVLAATLLVGCGKQKAGGPAATQPPASSETTTASDAAAQASAAAASQGARPPKAETAAQALDGPVHPFMTAQLRRFIAENGRLPKDFSEFSRAKMDSVPRLPPGLKFAIDAVTQEVKMVAQ